MKRIVFATGNMGKMREIREIMDGSGYEIMSMKEAGVDPDIVEDGKTFEENSLIKARCIREDYMKNKPQDYVNYEEVYFFADDSGLEVDALNKEPGVLSARYMGEDTSYHIKNQAIIDRLEGVKDEDRTARFVCAIAAIDMEGNETVVRETMEGRIGYKEAGENGFGYDPIFVLPEYGCTSSEISMEEKNKISHRGKALRKMMEKLLNR